MVRVAMVELNCFMALSSVAGVWCLARGSRWGERVERSVVDRREPRLLVGDEFNLASSLVAVRHGPQQRESVCFRMLSH